MASTQEIRAPAPELYRCYHCGVESTETSFKYFDNKKVDQPRYQCHNCKKFFTLGSHGRRQGKTYAKKRNEDPAELKSLSRQCRHCGVADNALFKYYNNNNPLQPRFECLSCGKQFQMRLMGTGEERRLVHTSSQQATGTYRRKPGVRKSFLNASNSFDPLMPLESSTKLFPEMSDEDVQYLDFLVTELAEEENTEADPLSWNGNEDNGNRPSPSSDEAVEYWRFLEAELLTEEKNEARNIIDAFSSTGNVDGELPPAWSSKDAAELMDFIGAELMDNEAFDAVDVVADNMTEMVSESTSSDAEVMYGTLVVDRPTTLGFDSWTWSHNGPSADPSSMSCEAVAAACCRQMDMDTGREISTLCVAPVQSTVGSECSSSSADSTVLFADPFGVIPEPHLVQQALTEDEQCFDFRWNEGEEAEEDMEMAPWAFSIELQEREYILAS